MFLYKKILIMIIFVSLTCAIFSSSQSKSIKDPGFYTLRKDPTFANTYQSTLKRYQELLELIESNKTEEFEDQVICQQEEATFVFHKASKIIESFSFRYRMTLYPTGRISLVEQ